MKTPVVSSQSSVVSAPSELAALREIPLAQLRVAEWNARKTFDPVALAELTESIRAHGLQVPLLVRPLSLSEWRSTADADAVERGEALFEIVAGRRRFKAAQDLQLATVPCIVRELTDDQAREIGIIDNLQREDVPALEEADGYADLQQRVGSAAAIAQRVGKSVAYVAKRLQLVKLCVQARDVLRERLMTVDHALLLARLGEQEQLANLKWLLNPNAGVKEKLEAVIAYRLKDRAEQWSNWEPQSVPSLQNHIEQHVGRKLSRAPWGLTATNLTEDGVACAGCPSNTHDNTALFGDLDIDEATCENGRCFEEKRAAFVHIQIAKAPPCDEKIPALKLSWKDSTAKPRSLIQSNDRYLAQTFRHGQWVEAKKGSCSFAHTGVTVDWSDDNHHGFGPRSGKLRKPGEQLLVCVAAKCKAHPKAWEKAAKESVERPNQNQNSPEARAAREKQAVLAKAENDIRIGLLRKALDSVKTFPAEVLRRVVLMAMPGWSHNGGPDDLLPGCEDVLRKKKVDSPEFARAASALVFLDEGVDCFTSEYEKIDYGREQFLKLLRLFGIDGSSAWPKPEAEKKPAAKKAVLTPAQRKKIAAEQTKRLAKKGGRK